MLSEFAAVMLAPAFWVMPPALEARTMSLPVRAPATFNDSPAPVNVTCRVLFVELLAFSVTVLLPPIAVSVITVFPLALVLNVVAFVAEMFTVPVLDKIVREGVLSVPPTELTPIIPSRVMLVVADRPARVRFTLPAVDFKLKFATPERNPNPPVASETWFA